MSFLYYFHSKKYTSLDDYIRPKNHTLSKVYIIEANEGIMPYKKAVLEKDIEEERRLFYVALTRTKNKVYLLAPTNDKEKSIFIKELKDYDNVIESKDVVDII